MTGTAAEPAKAQVLSLASSNTANSISGNKELRVGLTNWVRKAKKNAAAQAGEMIVPRIYSWPLDSIRKKLASATRPEQRSHGKGLREVVQRHPKSQDAAT